MDAKMSTKAAAASPDVVTVTSERRPTPTKMSFSEVMGQGTGTLVGGAESAMTALPGTSMVALAVRGGTAGAAAPMMSAPGASPLGGIGGSIGVGGGLGGLGTAVAEGPVVANAGGFGGSFLASATAASGTGDGGAAASLQQSEQSNLYYLQLQQQVNQQSQTFETLSNVMKSESDTVKNAIGNMH